MVNLNFNDFYKKSKDRQQQEEQNNNETNSYSYKEVISGETELGVGIEHDPRFKSIIEEALKGIDLTEEALMQNPEVVEKANKIAEEKGEKDWKKYLKKASLVVISAGILNACYYPGVKPENKEGAAVNVLIACSKIYGGKDGRLCQEAMLDGKDVIVRDANIFGRKVKTDESAKYGKEERQAVHCDNLPTRTERETCRKANNGEDIYIEETRE